MTEKKCFILVSKSIRLATLYCTFCIFRAKIDAIWLGISTKKWKKKYNLEESLSIFLSIFLQYIYDHEL